MSGHTEGQVESRAADPYRAAFDPGVAVGAQPRRPTGQRRRRAVEGERDRGHPERQGLDAEIRYGELSNGREPPSVLPCRVARDTRMELTDISL